MRKCEIDLDNILDLVICADDYGFNRDVLMHAFYRMTGGFSDDELKQFLKEFTNDGYGQEDIDDARVRLLDWRDKWLPCEVKK